MAWLSPPWPRAVRVVDGIWQVGVPWSERMGPDAGPKVPDERPAAGAQDAADLGQAGHRVGPVVHRQSADDQVERSIGECQGGYVADDKRWPALVAVPRAVGVGRARAIMAGSRSRPVTSNAAPPPPPPLLAACRWAGAGPAAKQDLQPCQQLPQAQADAAGFGRRSRSRVRNPWATETRVTWWCHPARSAPRSGPAPSAPLHSR